MGVRIEVSFTGHSLGFQTPQNASGVPAPKTFAKNTSPQKNGFLLAFPGTRKTYKKGGGQPKPGSPATRRKPGFRLKNLVLLPETRTKNVQPPYKSSTKPVFSVLFLKPRFLL